MVGLKHSEIKIFFTHKGLLSNFQRICGGSKTFRNQKILFFPYLLYPRATFPSWPKRSGEKSIFQPPLAYNAIESLFDEDELEKQDEEMMLEDAI